MGKRRRYLRGLIAAGFWALSTAVAAAECARDRVDLRGDFGQARFTVELADTDATRARGLMHRETLPTSHGMLFVYPTPRHVTFWMRNTLISLDIIFVSSDGTVQRVHENAVPLDETLIDGGPEIMAVLEVNGGLAARFGIGPGDVLRHPVFGDAAAWPCAAG